MFHRVHVRCMEVLPLQTHDLRASNGGDALEFGASQLDRDFSQLGMGNFRKLKYCSIFQAFSPCLVL